jgi:hypothetical protein
VTPCFTFKLRATTPRLGERQAPKETVMHHARRIAAVMTGLVALLVASATTPALATLPPGSPKHTPVSPNHPAGTVSQVHSLIVGGTPGWQIALIALAAALVAATAAVTVDRARTGRRKPNTVAA